VKELVRVRAIVQRVSEASVEVDGRVCGAVENGFLVYLGVAHDDAGRMNLDVNQAGGRVLVISAFTVQADARRGRRPTFESAAPQDHAIVLYELFCDALLRSGLHIERGSFGDHMDVKSVNDGPICVLLDSRRTF